MFYSKVIGRSVNTFIPLGEETINSSVVERCRSLMDPQSHPLLHYLVRMKPTSTNIFLEVAKNVKVTRGKIWAVRRMLKYSQPNPEAYHSPDWQYGDGRYRAKGWFRPTALQGVLTLWRVATLSVNQETNHISLIFFACLHFQCWTNTLCTTLTFRVIKKQACGPVRFHYACLLPYRCEYRYVTTVLPDFARNMFYGGFPLFIWLALIINFEFLRFWKTFNL